MLFPKRDIGRSLTAKKSDPASFGTHFVQSFSICYDERSDSISLGWSVIYKVTGPNNTTKTRRGRLVKIVQFVSAKNDTDTIVDRCFAFISRYTFRRRGQKNHDETGVVDDVGSLDGLSGQELRDAVLLDELSCVKLWVGRALIDVVPTRNVLQSFSVFHRCGPQCGATGADK